MTGGWNLPPGVTGQEPEIAGPDTEEDQLVWCSFCGTDRRGLVQTFGPNATFTCDTCGRRSDVDLLPAGRRM